ncbi:DNA replication/repair protein RecF [Epidermidibacterium keratini]|uniref:DNA replication and repair protein RecF n=1 Tax=Epidermidibacterium keratini TaxID=1891644 RepID=A0A7L4YMV1_9ACTN|nr:DNA replication/repair protein RecF [Epidermidibacterium keratini]QHC00476.1 DNA replication/repair protein RecF [Epidermidibacterium keratini]
MRLSRLQVIDFRNYAQAELELQAGPTVLVGSNGQGKTNIVEAIGYLSTLGSHRVASDQPLIRRGAERAVIRAIVLNDDRELSVELEITAGKANRARIGRAPVGRTKDVIGIVRSVLFAPEDLSLVKGDPSDRRRFLDELLVQRYPRYAGVRSDYERVRAQRNALLRTAGMARRAGKSGDLSTLDAWDEHLIAHGAALLHGRLELVHDLSPHFQTAYAAISGSADDVAMRYRTLAEDVRADADDVDDPQAPEEEIGVPDIEELSALMRTRLAAMRAKEVERGMTLVGPHRDELLLRLDDFPAKGYASHGQSWSIALALRLAAYELLRAEGAEPILLLDDVFAELDAKRRAYLSEVAKAAEQTIITAAVEADVPDGLEATTHRVTAGTIAS